MRIVEPVGLFYKVLVCGVWGWLVWVNLASEFCLSKGPLVWCTKQQETPDWILLSRLLSVRSFSRAWFWYPIWMGGCGSLLNTVPCVGFFVCQNRHLFAKTRWRSMSDISWVKPYLSSVYVYANTLYSFQHIWSHAPRPLPPPLHGPWSRMGPLLWDGVGGLSSPCGWLWGFWGFGSSLSF